jgi:hypothetical protein
MEKVYNYLDLKPFNHNFSNVEQYTKEDDEGVHKIPNLHNIRPKVEPIPHCCYEVLGKNLSDKYSNLEIWRN